MDERPPTLNYSGPAQEPADPYRAIVRFVAISIAIPAFVFGVVGCVYGFLALFGFDHRWDRRSGMWWIVLGLCCLYLTHRLARFKR